MVSVASTIIKKFSFDDHVLDDLSILMPENRCISVATVLRLADRFPSALPEDHLEDELLDYTLMPAEELPATSTEASDSAKNEELCLYWQEIGRLWMAVFDSPSCQSGELSCIPTSLKCRHRESF